MKLKLLAGALLAALMFAGCAHSGSNAAIVGDKVVTEAEVREVTDACIAVTKTKRAQMRLVVANSLIAGAVADELMRQTGNSFTDAERVEVLKGQIPPEVIQNQGCRKVAFSIADIVLTEGKLGKEATTEAIMKIKVDVNPKYGTFDNVRRQITGVSGSLSQIAADAEA